MKSLGTSPKRKVGGDGKVRLWPLIQVLPHSPHKHEGFRRKK